MNGGLCEPELPGTTDNVIRLWSNTGASLHLEKPLGFELDDSKLKRAGLDYHEWAQIKIHDDWSALRLALREQRWFAITTKGSSSAFETSFQAGDVLVFGPETRGLPAHYLAEFDSAHRLRLPMQADSRSLNLSNSVAVMVYEAWRQAGFMNGR